MNPSTNFDDLIKHFGTPLNAALALGFCRPSSSLRVKRNGGSRVGNWKRTGIPPKMQIKIAAVIAKSQPPSPAPITGVEKCEAGEVG